MKTALITTTINIPHVLKLYRKLGPDVRFFVAGDKNTPQAAYDFCDAIPNCIAGRPTSQVGWKCSASIGWRCIQRKNIALLEAIRWGADIILTTDDDNAALDISFFPNLLRYFWFNEKYETSKFQGVEVSSGNGWFDPGQLLTPAVRHRGLPIDVLTMVPELRTAVDVKIGVMAGLWVGDGDVDATHRIALSPEVRSANALAQAGVVVAHDTKTVFNAQNVAFRRELAPAMFLSPGLGRSDDIFASLICQRVMCEHGMQVHIGKPFTACWQNRSTKSLLDDLQDEQFGMRHVKMFAEYLDKNPLKGRGTVEYLRWLYTDLQSCAWWPPIASEAALAFLADIEPIL